MLGLIGILLVGFGWLLSLGVNCIDEGAKRAFGVFGSILSISIGIYIICQQW